MAVTKKFSLIACLIGGLLLAPVLGAAPKIQTWTTDNGAQVLFVEAPELPMVDVRVVFNAGSARNAKPGVASLASAVLDQGAGPWNADQIAERLEGVGAELGGGSLRDMAWMSIRSLTREPALSAALETFTTILADPTFPQDAFERLRKTTLVVINQDRQKPRTVGRNAFYKALYPDHPYAIDPIGTQESVEGMSRQDLIEHFQRYYVAKNAVVAIVGAVDRAKAEQVAAQVTSGLAPGEAAPKLPEVASLTEAHLELKDFPSSQSHVFIGQPGMSRKDADYFELYVGNHILGGNGLVSLLSQEVREKRGLSYSVYSYFLPMQVRGPFMMGLQTKNAQAAQAREVLMETFHKFVRQGPSEEQLTASKQNITGGFPLRIASNSKIVEYLAVIGFYDLPLDYLETFNAKVEAVTRESIKEAFQRRLKSESFATIVVGEVQEPKVAGEGRP